MPGAWELKYLNIPIGGLQKQSLIDYPGNISTIVFTQGCNFRCSYCHNPQLVYPAQFKDSAIELSEVLSYIKTNCKLLDAVVITGGEPTIHSDLPFFIREIKSLGLKVKLDTNGTNPDMLADLIDLKLVDYVAMDVKAPLELEKYRDIIGNNISQDILNQVIMTIGILKQRKVDYEFRTTVNPVQSLEDLRKIINFITGKLYLQKAQMPPIAIPAYKSILSKRELLNMINVAREGTVFLRGY